MNIKNEINMVVVTKRSAAVMHNSFQPQWLVRCSSLCLFSVYYACGILKNALKLQSCCYLRIFFLVYVRF